MRDRRGTGAPEDRVELVDRIARLLSGPNGTGVVVAGERGMGKTALMQEVLSRIQKNTGWTKIATGPALGATRYGTLAPFMASSDGQHIDSDESMLRSVSEALGVASGQRSKPMVVVDDAHYLDAASAELLGQLVATNLVVLFALSPPGQLMPRTLRTLWMEGAVERVDLQPLTTAASKTLCEDVLGAPMSAMSSLLLWKVSGGLPLALSALVNHNRDRGILVLRGGIWRLIDQPSLTGDELLDLVRDRLREVPTGALAVLELLALVGPMPFTCALEGTEPRHLTLLEEEGLITVGSDPQSMVSVANPLYAALIRELVPPGRSAMLFSHTRELMARHENAPGYTVDSVEWALGCGQPVPDHALIAAARDANLDYRPHLAARIAETVTAPKYRVQARVQTAHSNYLLGIPDAAVLGEALELAPDMATATEAAVWAARFTQQHGQHPDQVEVVTRRWARTARRLAAQRGEGDAVPPADAVSIRTLELYGMNLAARYRESAPAIQDLVNGSTATPEDRFFLQVYLGEAYGAQGRPRTGATLLTDASRQVMAAEAMPRRHQEFAFLHGAVCSIFSAEWDELAVATSEYLDASTTSLVYFGAVPELFSGFSDLRRGALLSARENLASAVEGLQSFDPYQLRPLALGLAAYAASLAGDRERAAGYIDRFDQRDYDGGRQFLLLGAAYVAASRGMVAADSPDGDHLRRVRDEACDAGLVSVEMHVIELSVRAGDLSGLKRLLELSRDAEGTEARILNLYAAALLSERQHDLIAAAEEAGRAGFSLLAVDAASRVIAALKAAGSNVGMARAYQVLKTYHPRTGNVELPFPHRPSDLPRLSPREFRVAQLVAQGASNRAAASHLSVSLRTVEGHLYRIFKKVGITRREELTPALVAIIERDQL